MPPRILPRLAHIRSSLVARLDDVRVPPLLGASQDGANDCGYAPKALRRHVRRSCEDVELSSRPVAYVPSSRRNSDRGVSDWQRDALSLAEAAKALGQLAPSSDSSPSSDAPSPPPHTQCRHPRPHCQSRSRYMVCAFAGPIFVDAICGSCDTTKRGAGSEKCNALSVLTPYI